MAESGRNAYATTSGNGAAGSPTVVGVVNDGTADRQIVALGDTNSTNLSKWSSKQYPFVELDPTSLMYDGFSAALDTTNVWTTGGTAPTASSGNLTFNASTTANATSYLSSQPSFTMVASVFLRAGALVTLASGAETGSKAFFGFGTIAGSPTMAVPLQNGVVFEIKDTDGSMVGVVYSNGVRVTEQALAIPAMVSAPVLSSGRPSDGNLHRYAVNYRASRAYFEIDDIVVGSIAAPNPQVVNLPWVAGVFNGVATLGAARTITISTASVADTGRNGVQNVDGTLPWRKQTVDSSGNAYVKQPDTTATGSITTQNLALGGTATANSAVTLTTLDSKATVTIQVTGTYGGASLVFQGSVDGTNWITFGGVPLVNVATGASVATIPAAAVGIWQGDGAGMAQVRVTASASVSSGTAVVTIRATLGSGLVALDAPLPAGTNSIGVVDTELPAAAALADGVSRTASVPSVAAYSYLDNGATADRQRANWNVNTGDSGAKTTTGNGATQTNFNARGANILFNVGTVSGTTPTCVFKLQGSSDGGTTFYDIPGASTASLTATGAVLLQLYPALTAAANATVNQPLPRTWRVVWTIGGTTPSFTITNIQVGYIN